MLAYIDYGSHDGVDLKVATANFWASISREMSGRSIEPSAVSDGTLVDTLPDLEAKLPVEQSYGVSKIPQNDTKISIVFDIRNVTTFFTGHFVNLLRAVDRTTGEASLLKKPNLISPCC